MEQKTDQGSELQTAIEQLLGSSELLLSILKQSDILPESFNLVWVQGRVRAIHLNIHYSMDRIQMLDDAGESVETLDLESPSVAEETFGELFVAATLYQSIVSDVMEMNPTVKRRITQQYAQDMVRASGVLRKVDGILND